MQHCIDIAGLIVCVQTCCCNDFIDCQDVKSAASFVSKACNRFHSSFSLPLFPCSLTISQRLASQLVFAQDPAEPNMINARVMQRIVGGKYDFPSSKKVSPECLDLIAKIFTPDPAKRIKTEDIKRHPWLSGLHGQTPLACPPPHVVLDGYRGR